MCGIIGVIHSPAAAEEIYLGLQNLQHRGQDGVGIVTLDAGEMHSHRGAGLVDIAFPIENFKRLTGSVGIGHTRYATVGKKDPCMLQPFISDKTQLTIAHNGNIVNFHVLREQIQAEDPAALQTGSDSELILYLLDRHLAQSDGSPSAFFAALTHLSEELVGSYSVVGLSPQYGLFAFRDLNGLRPLVMGTRSDENGTSYAFSSETAALAFTSYDDLEDIGAGEGVLIPFEGPIMRQSFATAKTHHCMFEWVYFARVESTIDDVPVYQARFNLGVELAHEVIRQNIHPDIVVPVPETSRIAAIALAEKLNVPFREVLIKNRYVNRTFILESQTARKEAIRRKLYPVASELRGKKVLVVDDSIVRGNTAIKIVEMLRQSGASEIYLASTCPPIEYPCYYGIDFPDHDELMAGKYPHDQLASVFGVDHLVYQTLEGLQSALAPKKLCTACLTGSYPSDVSFGKAFTALRAKERGEVYKETVAHA